MATAVGGTHPTVMHSCYELNYSLQAGPSVSRTEYTRKRFKEFDRKLPVVNWSSL